MVNSDAALQIVLSLQRSELEGPALRRQAMDLLARLPNYDWCGIYRLEEDTLVLDAFVGSPTEHTRIPVGKGVCGTAVSQNRNQVVEDVNALENYLACSAKTRAEIVVLIRDASGSVLGQIDVDSHRFGAFDATDEAMLEQVAKILAKLW